MDSEPEFRATPAEIARITRTALTALAQDHIIIPKDELSEFLNSHSTEMLTDMWAIIIDTYTKSGVQLAEAVSPERYKGYELGGKVLSRMHDVFLEEYAETFEKNHAENTETSI